MSQFNNEIWEKEGLINDLEDTYALIEVSHKVLKQHNVLGLESVQEVLRIAYEKIDLIQTKEKAKLDILTDNEVQS